MNQEPIDTAAPAKGHRCNRNGPHFCYEVRHSYHVRIY